MSDLPWSATTHGRVCEPTSIFKRGIRPSAVRIVHALPRIVRRVDRRQITSGYRRGERRREVGRRCCRSTSARSRCTAIRAQVTPSGGRPGSTRYRAPSSTKRFMTCVASSLPDDVKDLARLALTDRAHHRRMVSSSSRIADLAQSGGQPRRTGARPAAAAGRRRRAAAGTTTVPRSRRSRRKQRRLRRQEPACHASRPLASRSTSDIAACLPTACAPLRSL